MPRQAAVFLGPCNFILPQVVYTALPPAGQTAAIDLMVTGLLYQRDAPAAGTLAFTSELHAIRVRHMFYGARQEGEFPGTEADMCTFLPRVVERMSAAALAKSDGRGSAHQILERQYQAEFYRCEITDFAVLINAA